MKTIIALLTSVSAMASACPNLAGSYTCRADNGATIGAVVVQPGSNHFILQLAGQEPAEVVADGKKHQESGTANGVTVDASVYSRCNGETVASDSTISIRQSNSSQQIVTKYEMTKLNSNSMRLAFDIRMTENGTALSPIVVSVVCTK